MLDGFNCICDADIRGYSESMFGECFDRGRENKCLVLVLRLLISFTYATKLSSNEIVFPLYLSYKLSAKVSQSGGGDNLLVWTYRSNFIKILYCLKLRSSNESRDIYIAARSLVTFYGHFSTCLGPHLWT